MFLLISSVGLRDSRAVLLTLKSFVSCEDCFPEQWSGHNALDVALGAPIANAGTVGTEGRTPPTSLLCLRHPDAGASGPSMRLIVSRGGLVILCAWVLCGSAIRSTIYSGSANQGRRQEEDIRETPHSPVEDRAVRQPAGGLPARPQGPDRGRLSVVAIRSQSPAFRVLVGSSLKRNIRNPLPRGRLDRVGRLG